MDDIRDKKAAPEGNTGPHTDKAAEGATASGKVLIPNVTYQGSDKKLKERISKFKTGSLRIALFTLVGLFLGYYSHTYVTDTFFPTKLVTAIPYKIMEAIYGSVLRVHTYLPKEFWGYTLTGNFFPYSAVACLLAEPVTTVLIGGAVYGSLGYFTGDKRVFTLQRFLKFAGCWCAVILLVIGTAFGINAKARSDNENFGEVAYFFFHDGEGRGGSQPAEEPVIGYFYSELVPADTARDWKAELPLGIYFDDGRRYGLYQVNLERQYVVTEQGKMYHISKEFAQVITDFWNRDNPSGGSGGKEAAK